MEEKYKTLIAEKEKKMNYFKNINYDIIAKDFEDMLTALKEVIAAYEEKERAGTD